MTSIHRNTPGGDIRESTHRPIPRGAALLHDPIRNKGTAFTLVERDALGLRGLLPPRVLSQAQQVARVMENLRRKPNDIEKYLFLISLQDRNETLFYRVVTDHLEEIMPLIYTPTVGQACREYGHIFRRPRGLYVSTEDQGRMDECLANWPHRDVDIIVVTDGERILGLGDLGLNGIGIPIGKLSLYTACAGVPPEHCLPVVLDVGTNNGTLREDPLYLGLSNPRLTGEPYKRFVEEFLTAVGDRFPHALVQFEDFGNPNALRLLARYRNRICCFNDDIQGTAAVVLAGLYAATRITGKALREQTLLICGAGGAGIGIGQLFVRALMAEGVSETEARQRCWCMDSKGILSTDRSSTLNEFQRDFAHNSAPVKDLLSAVAQIQPTTLIGVSGKPGIFTRPVIEALAHAVDRPVVFALSNPTSCAECTAEQAYQWSAGRAVFASGSPFSPVTFNQQTYAPGQGNNAYIFPGVGMGVILSGATHVTDSMFLTAAKALATMVSSTDLALGRLYPTLAQMREISLHIAMAVAEEAYRIDLARYERPSDLETWIRAHMFKPCYRNALS